MGGALFASAHKHGGSAVDSASGLQEHAGLLLDVRHSSSSSAYLVGDGQAPAGDSGQGDDYRRPGSGSPSRNGYTVDETIEYLGVGRFHFYAGIICGIANAADAVELLAIGYIIPKLDVHGEAKGAVKRSSGVFPFIFFYL